MKTQPAGSRRAVIISNAFKFLDNLIGGSFGAEAGYDNGNAAHDEGGEQFIDIPRAAQGAHQILPDEHRCPAADKPRHSAGAVGALPEKGEEHQRAEGRAKARPGKGDDGEN